MKTPSLHWLSPILRGSAVALLATGLSACVPADDDTSNTEFIYEGGTISTPTTWSGTVILAGGVDVESTLTLEPCTTVRVRSNVNITVANNGSIRSLGEEDCPVTIRSAATVPGRGDWGAIDIYSSASNDTLFQYTNIHHADGGNFGAVWVEGNASVEFKNVQISDVVGAGIAFEQDARIRGFENVHVANGDKAAVSIHAGEVSQLGSLSGEGLGTMGVSVVGDSVTAPGTWKKLGLPYYVESVSFNARVEIEAGTVLKMQPNSVLKASETGSIRALGTAEEQVIFESAKSAPAAGDWTGFEIYDTAGNDNLLRHAIVRHANGAEWGAIWYDGAGLELDNVTFEHNNGCDVYGNEPTTVTNTTYNQCGD